MKTKITNVSFVAVLLLAFTVYVAGLGGGASDGDARQQVVTEGDANGDGVVVRDEVAGDPPASVVADDGSGTAAGPRSKSVKVDGVPTATPTRTPTPINVGNFVWDDLDGDGRQDGGEPGLADITVQLWNDAKTQLLDTDVTNGSGSYTVIAPTPGTYRVRVILPNAGDAFSPENQAGGDDTLDSDINPTGGDLGFTDTLTFASNLISTTTVDAGIVRFVTPTPTRTPTPINVGNFVWDDLDGDGRQDASEDGLAGVTVQLWNSAKTSLLDTDVTSGTGNYTVVAPTPGTYRVRVILPNAGDAFSPKDQAGGDDQLDSDINPTGGDLGFTDTLTFAPNLISITTIDAGIVRFVTPTPTRTPTPINVGNFVWDDEDGDGIQDGGEPGIEGITVQLWNSAKTSLLDTDVTNGSGAYAVVAPTPGTYRVRVLKPSTATFSPQDAGSDDLVDSDIDPGGSNAGFTDTLTFAPNLISITTVDAGITGYVGPDPTTTTTSTSTTTSTTLPGSTTTDPLDTTTSSSTTTTAPDGSTTTTGPGSTTTTDAGSTTTVPDTVPGPEGPPDAFYVEGSQLTKAKTVRAGDPVTLTLGGAAPGSDVDIVLYSDPVPLGTATAGSDGSFIEPYTIPLGTAPGEHEISFVGETPGGTPFDLRLDLTVVAGTGVGSGGAGSPGGPGVADGDLPRTGSSGTQQLVAFGLTLLAAGVAVVGLRRRRVGQA